QPVVTTGGAADADALAAHGDDQGADPGGQIEVDGRVAVGGVGEGQGVLQAGQQHVDVRQAGQDRVSVLRAPGGDEVHGGDDATLAGPAQQVGARRPVDARQQAGAAQVQHRDPVQDLVGQVGGGDGAVGTDDV